MRGEIGIGIGILGCSRDVYLTFGMCILKVTVYFSSSCRVNRLIFFVSTSLPFSYFIILKYFLTRKTSQLLQFKFKLLQTMQTHAAS